MQVLDIILVSLMLATGLFVIFAVLMQHGKSHGLSGTIAGGAETFFGKEKGRRIDKVFNKLTTIAAAVFLLLVLIVYFKQPDYTYNPGNETPVGMIVQWFCL